MIEFLTILLSIIQILSIIQRKGIVIDLNQLQIALRNDLAELINNGDKQYSIEVVIKKMSLITLFFSFFYFSYFLFIFLEGVISKEVFGIALCSILMSLILEFLFYRKAKKAAQFKPISNLVISIIATSNSVLQIALIISIIFNILE